MPTALAAGGIRNVRARTPLPDAAGNAGVDAAPESSGAAGRSRLRAMSLIVCVWTLVALFTSQLQQYAITRSGGRADWSQLFSSNLLSCLLWAALTPAIFALGQRYRIDRKSWYRTLPLHFVFGACCTVIDVVVMNAARPWINPFGQSPVRPLDASVAGLLFLYLACYFVIVALGHVAYYATLSRDQALRAARLEARVNAAHLDALQAQLRPHFLFNTLSTIAEQVHFDPDAADAMILRLSRLLRSSFANPEVQEVSVREELELLECYLEIARVRFRERLQVTLDVPLRLREALIPRLVLQPLVENALQHGIEPLERGGHLEVLIGEDAEWLTVEVRDNGTGLRPHRGGTGTGLGNTRARLQLLYGDAHEFGLRTRSEGGTVAWLRVPLRSHVARQWSARSAAAPECPEACEEEA